MTLSEVFTALGRERFDALLRLISIGSLKTYKVYDGFKIRTRLPKLNRERLRKAAERLWERLGEGDEDLAREISQGVLVSHIEFVVETLDFLGIPHDGAGFFDKDAQADDQLTEGWQARVLEHFRDDRPEALILLYINHLDWELGKPESAFTG